MTKDEIAAARALVAAAPTWIETENVGRPYVPDYAPTHESTDAYIGMLNALPKLLDEVERLLASNDRLATIASEAFGPFPVQSVEDNLTAIEHGCFEARRDRERARPVVEAAKAWRDYTNLTTSDDLAAAVDAYIARTEPYSPQAAAQDNAQRDVLPASPWASFPPRTCRGCNAAWTIQSNGSLYACPNGHGPWCSIPTRDIVDPEVAELRKEAVRLTKERDELVDQLAKALHRQQELLAPKLARPPHYPVEAFDCEDTPGRNRCMACHRPLGGVHCIDCDRIADAGNRELREMGRPK